MFRVSTDKQETDNQLQQLREFAGKQSWEVVQEYCDVATGSNGDRDQFQAMLLAANQRKFDALLFWSLDRLTREGALPTLQYLTQLSGWGICFRSYTEPYLDSCGMFKDAVIVSWAALPSRNEPVSLKEPRRVWIGQGVKQDPGTPRVTVDAGQINDLRAQGLSWEAVSEQTGIARATCERAVQDLDPARIRILEVLLFYAPCWVSSEAQHISETVRQSPSAPSAAPCFDIRSGGPC